MNKSLRFAALTAILTVIIWGGPARSSQAQQFSCDPPYPNPCRSGSTATCIEADGGTRTCQCVYFGGRGWWWCRTIS